MKVYVHGPGALEYRVMFHNRGYKGSKTPEEADLVCFTGGEDVYPGRYGEAPITETSYNLTRDQDDVEMYDRGRAEGKFLVGICRGGQFLNVMNGGRMWQDVTDHGRPHELVDVKSGMSVMCTSTHHQMMDPANDGLVLATAHEARYKKSWNRAWVRELAPLSDPYYNDVEVVYYPKTRSLCFQPHPEFQTAPKECTDYFFSLLEKYSKAK